MWGWGEFNCGRYGNNEDTQHTHKEKRLNDTITSLPLHQRRSLISWLSHPLLCTNSVCVVGHRGVLNVPDSTDCYAALQSGLSGLIH